MTELRDRQGLYAFLGLDDRWHIDWRDATNPTAMTAESYCGVGGRLLLPTIKAADSVRPTELCVACWGL